MKSLNRIITPLNMLAMLAALSEASAATVLPYMDEEPRKVLIGFIIIFPCALSALLFFTGNFVIKTPSRPAGFAHISRPSFTGHGLHLEVTSTAVDEIKLKIVLSSAPTDVQGSDEAGALLMRRFSTI